jgi:hypothetical protein
VQDSIRRWLKYLETVDLDGLRINFETIFGDEEFLNIFALISLKLNHLAHLTVRDNGAIACWDLLVAVHWHCCRYSLTELLFDHLEDLLLVELLRNSLYSGQSLTTISLCE